MDELLKQIASYGPAGITIAVLLLAIGGLLGAVKALFLRYDAAMKAQIMLGEQSMAAQQACTTALEKVSGLVESQQAQIAGIKTALELRRRG